MLCYSNSSLRQTPPQAKATVETRNSWRDTFVLDCQLLEQLWSRPDVTLEEIRRLTHWRHVQQVSRIAREKLGLPQRRRGRKAA